jgi:hypothetical protein
MIAFHVEIEITDRNSQYPVMFLIKSSQVGNLNSA